MRDQAEQLRSLARNHGTDLRRQSLCRVLTVTGGKGGVGKSSVALNLSLALAGQGARVLLFDADLGLANLDLMLGVHPQVTLEDVANGRCRLVDTLIDTGHGMDLLPGGAGIPELADLGSLALVRMIGQLRELEGNYDYIVIDTAAGIGESVARFALPADDVLLVCTPDPPAMLDAYSVIKMLCARGFAGNLHLVVNMVRAADEVERTHGSIDKVTRRYLTRGINLLGGLPYDEQILHSTRQQRPLMVSQPAGHAAAAVRALIPGLYGLPVMPPAPSQQGFFSRMFDGVKRAMQADNR